MLLVPTLRRYRRFFFLRQNRPIFYSLVFLLLLDTFINITTRPTTTQRVVLPPSSSSSFSSTAAIVNRQDVLPSNDTIFVVSVHRNTEKVLHAAWNQAIIDLAHHFGPDRMFFSAVESGSQDGTKARLLELKDELNILGVGNDIRLGISVQEQLRELADRPPADGQIHDGWVWNPHEKRWDMRRIPYLSRVRNQAMEPMYEMEEQEGRQFDRVLWINDVVFDTEDILTLLTTRSGAYAAACSMDYKSPPHYYDTFALRDIEGDKAMSPHWPWFQSHISRRAAHHLDPIPVKSCWNGIVAFDARPFYSVQSPLSPEYDSSLKRRNNANNIPNNSHNRNIQKRNAAATEPDPHRLSFRGIPDTLADLHLEGSECCLIHADNPLSTLPGLGVWLNPNVRVGYSVEAYKQVRPPRYPASGRDALVGVWNNRWCRIQGMFQLSLEKWTIYTRLRKWVAIGKEEGATEGYGLTEREEKGDFCLINEMQIMWSNGWRHL